VADHAKVPLSVGPFIPEQMEGFRWKSVHDDIFVGQSSAELLREGLPRVFE